MSKQNGDRTAAHSGQSAVSSRRRSALLMSAASFALAISWPMSARAQSETALPSGGSVVGGTATIGTPSNAQMQIDQSSNRAIINWDSFDIGSGAQVRFVQPSASAIALNRVVGGSAPSQIAGQLNANGIVAVINSNGVMFAGTANVNVGGLIASAADVADEAFMNGGALSFTGFPSSMSEIIVSAGANISIADQGLGLFFAPVVRNAGVISARLGHVTLASGSSATLDLDGTGFLEIGLGNDNALVSNSGTINAGGGRIHMTAKAASAVIDQVVNTGILSVASATFDPDGAIILSAQSGNAVLGGSFDAGAAGSASVLAANEVKVGSAVAATGDLSLAGRRISGAGDIDVTDGALALTLDVAGADTSGEGNFIADALGVIGTVSGGTRLDLGEGIYAAGATIARNNVTIDGGGVATIVSPINSSQINGLSISGNGATITGLTFTSGLPDGEKAWDYAWGSSVPRGIAVLNGADGTTIRGNNITGLRNGILVDGRGATSLTITGNTIDNTKSAISLQYVDGSAPGFNISGNSEGIYGNEWGINLHLNGVWNGTTTTSGSGLLGANISLPEQARLLALSAANGSVAVYNQAYTASNRTHVTVAATGTSSAQGSVGTPLDTVQAGINAVVTGGKVTIGAGIFAEAVSIGKGLTLDGAGMDETAITGGITLSGAFSDLIFTNFAVSGASGTSVIRGGQVTNLTLDRIRIDGEGVTGRHGIAGGQYGGDISITNSEFLNIRGWSAFDTRSGAGSATDGTQITSAVFSNNLLDNTAGHIAFRQQAGNFTYPDITISDNIVRNGGDSDTTFGAIFKAFRANVVDFTGNVVSDVGTSTTAPSGEAVYGAVLITRDVGTLNVTGNSFTNNHQVFAVEPGFALPTVTNFTDNSFVNNGYAIYLPKTLSGAGTINFFGTNDFVDGADTVQHIVWRSGGALDLTGVSFNGTRADGLDLDGLFAAEDLITHAIDVNGAGLARLVDSQLFVTTASGTDSALRALALAANGDRLNLSAGTHLLSNTLMLQNSITLAGQGQGVTILDASGHNAYGIRVKASDVTLSGFTLNGSSNAVGNSNYGIKVESGGDSSARSTGFTISDVAIIGSRKTGLDINAAVDVLIDNVTVTGVAAGNGISITDSANVTVRNSRTSGNAWGGVALYQANNLNGGGSDQQLTGIMIEANNDFAEANGLYLQDSSSLLDVGTLNIQGYGFTVRNEAHRQGGQQFTFFQKTQQDAFDFGVNLAVADASVVQGWTGTADNANFHVGYGSLTGGGSAALSLQAAFDKSVSDAVIHVASGTYAQSASLIGARGLDFDDVTLDSLMLSGSGSSLRGNLALTGAGFSADAGLLLNGDSSITALAGNISLAGATGNAALLLTGNVVTLGQSSLASLGITGAQISTANVTTSGSQSYAGATSLSGSYAASDFSVTGSTLLTGGTSVTASGAARFAAVDGASAGGQSFAVAAGTAELGALGSQSRLGVTTISANQTVLGGAAYTANSLSFIGTGSDANVRLTQALTRFDTRAVGGNVSVAANLIGTSAGAQSVEILTGSGLAGGASEGDILLSNLGSDAVRLGSLRVVGGNFSAATIKLAGNFDSALSGNQLFTANTLDTLGSVFAVVKGSESGPIRAGGSVAVDAGSSGNGSIIAGGPVQLSYISDVARDVSSQSSVSVASSGSVGGSIAAAGPVAVNAVGPVSSSVTTGGSVEIASGGGISSNVTAGGGVNMTAATGDIVGAINATGPVSVGATQGSISSSISTTGSASLSSGGGISSAINAGGAVAVSAPGAITSHISSGGSIQLTSNTPINVVLNGGSVTVNAPGGTVGGVFSEISTGDGGSFVVNDQPVIGNGQVNPRQIIVDKFLVPVGGSIGASGEIILPAGMALGLIGPSGRQQAARPTMIVNSVEGLGDLLRRGYTAIIIQIDESGLELEREVASEAI